MIKLNRLSRAASLDEDVDTPTPLGMCILETALVLILTYTYTYSGESAVSQPLYPCQKSMFKPITSCETAVYPFDFYSLVKKRFECAQKCADDPNCKSLKIKPFVEIYECFSFNESYVDEGCEPNKEYFNKISCQNGGLLNADGTNCTCIGGYLGNFCTEIMKDCRSGYMSGMYTESGVYLVKPETSTAPFMVYCRMTSKNGYTVIQKNTGAENFNRTWDEYAQGFGDVTLDHWLGNTKISELTNQETANTLTVVFYAGGHWKLSYYFKANVTVESDFFRLSYDWYETEPEVDNQLGTCLTMQNAAFNTFDNDFNGGTNCAALRGGGWWFANCGKCTPNARVTGAPYSSLGDVNWQGLDKTLPVHLVRLMLS